MKRSNKLCELLYLSFSALLCLLLLGCSSAAVAVEGSGDNPSPVEQTLQLFLPLVVSSQPIDNPNISGFGNVRLISIANRAFWQGENRFIVAGTIVTDTNSENFDMPGLFAVARYFADGTLDRTFGKDGVALTQFADRSVEVRDLALQSDGRIVVAGDATPGTLLASTGETEIAIARYTEDGTLDASFSDDGRQTLDLDAGNNDRISAITLQTDGRILIAGSTSKANPTDWADTVRSANIALARLTTDGLLDESFGDDGKRFIDFAGVESTADIATFSSQRMMIVGNYCCFDINTGLGGITLNQTDGNGEIDTSFGDQGKLVTRFSDHAPTTARALIQPDGKLLMAGYYNNAPIIQLELVRYLQNGTLDTSFGENGKVGTNLGSENQFIDDALIQPDGKIVVAGGAGGIHGGCRCRTVLVRYTPDGALDESFDGDGILNDEFSELGNETSAALLLTPDNKILMIGQAAEYGAPNHLIIERYNADGTHDKSFLASQSLGKNDTYKNTIHGFSIEHPEAWEVIESSPDSGFIGKKVSWWIGNSDPLQCQGDCPEISEVGEMEIAGYPAKRVLGYYAGAIGDMGFQEYLRYIIQKGDTYFSFTLFAVDAKGMPGVINGDVVPLESEDITRVDTLVMTIQFDD